MNKKSIKQLTGSNEVSVTDEMHTQNRLKTAVYPKKMRDFSR